VNTFLTDRSQITANRAIRARMLGAEMPDPKWLLEIEAIAAA
jgi:2-iminobutanoate/2-iminopropanoate deaminase